MSDGIAHGGSVHIMLDKIFGEHRGADGQVLETPCRTRVDNPVRVAAVNKELCAHGGVDLSHTADVGQEVRLNFIDSNAAYRLQQLGRRGFQNAPDLALQGLGQSDHGGCPPYMLMLHYTTGPFCGKEEKFIDIR